MRLEKILLVDDEEDIRTLAAMTLESVGGWQVDAVESGAQALASAVENPPDIILLDATMPEMDGPATFEALRKEKATENIPVIFLTGKTQDKDVEGYLSLGALDVIKKPFDPMELPAQIRGICEKL